MIHFYFFSQDPHSFPTDVKLQTHFYLHFINFPRFCSMFLVTFYPSFSAICRILIAWWCNFWFLKRELIHSFPTYVKRKRHFCSHFISFIDVFFLSGKLYLKISDQTFLPAFRFIKLVAPKLQFIRKHSIANKTKVVYTIICISSKYKYKYNRKVFYK